MKVRALGVVRALRRLADDRRGSVAVITAIAMVPLVIAVGVGIDVSRIQSGRSNLQDALDATALALAHMPQGTPEETLKTKADAWMAANLANRSLRDVETDVDQTKDRIIVSATGNVPTTLSAILGVTEVPVSASSTVKWGSRLEVALVLDNTGSMEGQKLTDLISASKTMVDTLLAANAIEADSVKISIVPFSNTVNVGPSHQGEDWLDATAPAYRGSGADDIFGPNQYNGEWVDRWSLFTNLGETWKGCVETRPEWVAGVKKDYDITDVGFSDANPGTKVAPFFSPDGTDSGVSGLSGSRYNSGNNYLSDVTTSKVSWDRLRYTAKYDQVWKCKKGNCSYQPPTFINSGGPNEGCGIQPLQPLTTDSATLKTLLGKMVADGNTNVAMGLFWGWMTLSPNTPFTGSAYKQPVAYGADNYIKVVVVLTDGENTTSSDYTGIGLLRQSLITPDSGNSNSDASATAIDNREAKICANMKAKDIVIYAVPMEVTDKGAKKLLQDCVSSSDNYIDVESSSDLAAAFETIADSISKLRLAR